MLCPTKVFVLCCCVLVDETWRGEEREREQSLIKGYLIAFWVRHHVTHALRKIDKVLTLKVHRTFWLDSKINILK